MSAHIQPHEEMSNALVRNRIIRPLPELFLKRQILRDLVLQLTPNRPAHQQWVPHLLLASHLESGTSANVVLRWNRSPNDDAKINGESWLSAESERETQGRGGSSRDS